MSKSNKSKIQQNKGEIKWHTEKDTMDMVEREELIVLEELVQQRKLL